MSDGKAETLDAMEARSRALALAAEARSVPEEILDGWVAERRRVAESLDARGLEDASRVVSAELARIERDLQRLEERSAEPDRDSFRRVIECGERLRWALWLADTLSEELTMDPLALVEEELRRLELQASDLERIDGGQDPRFEAIRARLRETELMIVRARLRRFVRVRPAAIEVGPLERATRRWLAASESFQIEADLARAGAGTNAPKGSPEHESVESATSSRDDSLPALWRERKEHLDAARSALAMCGPEEAEEFVRAAVADLVDHVGGVLSEGESDAAPSRRRVLDLTVARIDAFRDVLGRWRIELGRRGALPAELRRRYRSSSKHLDRARRQTIAARSELQVMDRLDRTFGRKTVRRFERLVIILIFALLGLVYFEWRLPHDLPWILGGGAVADVLAKAIAIDAIRIFNYIDLAFCCVFQLDFFVRWAFAGWTLSYFLRHFFAESLPALPYGFLFHHIGLVEEARSVIVVRALRARGAAVLRALLFTFVRMFRVIAFFMRGVDRAVERFRTVLDRDIVIFAPEALSEAQESPLRRRASSLEARRQQLLRGMWADLPARSRIELLEGQAIELGAEATVSAELALPYRRIASDSKAEIRIERAIYNFLDCDVTRAISLVGKEGVEKVARWLRFIDVPGLRNMPLVRRLVPGARMLNPAEAVSFALNATGQVLQEILGVLRFWADLSGITTGPQILDRIGTAIVVASKRPAVRLILFGSLFVLIEAFFSIFHWSLLSAVSRTLANLLGVPILLLGSVCLVFFMLGRWFKRISGEALDYYLRTADAQFYSLIKSRKLLRRADDLEEIFSSVLLPEVRLRGAREATQDEWLAFLADPLRDETGCIPGRNVCGDPRFADFSEDRATIALLYRDFLDGPILDRADDKTSVQLLGNLAVQNVRVETLGAGIKELRRLERLSLERGSILSFGPYFWFRFITESLAIETAKLILEYNAVCIPLRRMHLATDRARERLAGFLEERTGRRPPSLTARHDELMPELSTAAFTALDFLCPTIEGDEHIRKTFGDDVLEALRRDRRAVVRDIFGTRPYHLLPRHQRVFNPYRLYWKYLGGAKFFLLPVLVGVAFLRLNLEGLRQIRELIREVIGKRRSRRIHLSRFAPFDVAIRKINRMRKPLFMEAIRLRAAVDVEYLGLHLLGEEAEPSSSGYERDLDFIGALDAERRTLEETRERTARDLRRFRAFLTSWGWREEPEPDASGNASEDSFAKGRNAFFDRLDPDGALRPHAREVLRALVTAYVTDHRQLRSILTAPDGARAWMEEATRERKRSMTEALFDSIALGFTRVLPTYRRRRALFEEYVALAEDLQKADRRLVRRALVRFAKSEPETERMIGLAVRVLRRESETQGDAVFDELRRAAFDFRIWTRKLVTIRMIQTLTVLDVRNYRDLVWTVGDYAADEKVAG